MTTLARTSALLIRDPTPAYHRIFQLLRQRIATGIHAVGDQLPTEDELMAEFAVSRHTVRAALQQLVVHGLIRRQAGKGSFVLHQDADRQQWAAQSLDDMVDSSFGSGIDLPGKRVLSDNDPIAAEARACFGGASPITCFSWRRTGPEGPYALAYVYLPELVGDQLPRDWVAQIRTVRLLHLVERCCGVRAHRVRQHSSAVAASAPDARQLDVDAGSPLLSLDRTYFGRDGSAIEYSRILGRPDRCRAGRRVVPRHRMTAPMKRTSPEYRLARRARDTNSDIYLAIPPGTIRLHGGSAFPGCLPDLSREAAEAAGRHRTESMQYGPLYGLAALREQVAIRAGRDGVACTAENILIVNGAKQGLELVCRALLDPGDTVIVTAPTYITAIPVFRANDAGLLQIGQDRSGLCTDELEQRLRELDAAGEAMPKLLYDIPDFHNPTGITTSAVRRRRMVELAERYGFLIIEDDTYRQVRIDGTPIPPVKAFDEAGVVIGLGTVSKIIAPGLRLGWVNAPPALLATLAALKADGGSSPFLQRIVADVMAAGGVEAHLHEVLPVLRDHRDAMLRGFARMMPDIAVKVPEGGYFVWAELPPGMDGDRLAKVALGHGVAVYPGSWCFAGTPQRNALRLAYSYSDTAEIEEGMQRLAAAYREMGAGQ